jgi:uncharacterized SAM-binding protein YcdF (DUF218 family)
MKNKNIVVVLGSPNSDQGKLGQIALDRLNFCLEIFEPKTDLILCTGGYGKHFNNTNEPHGSYAINYLMDCGIQEGSFIGIVLSSNTVQDAVKVKEMLANDICSLKIITSDYHLERAKIIFDAILTNTKNEFFGVTHTLSSIEKTKLLTHEKKAIATIKKNGLYF